MLAAKSATNSDMVMNNKYLITIWLVWQMFVVVILVECLAFLDLELCLKWQTSLVDTPHGAHTVWTVLPPAEVQQVTIWE